MPELAEKAELNADKMKADLEKSIQQSKKLQKDLQAVSRDMLEKKTMGYEEKKKIEDLLNQQKELQGRHDRLDSR